MRLPPRAKRKLFVAALASLALVLVAWQLRSRLELDWSVESLRAFVAGLGPWGPAAFVALVVLRPFLLIPSQLVLIAGGICFGALAGALYGGLGLFFLALTVFLGVRWVGADAVRGRIPAAGERALAVAGGRGGALLLTLITGYPVGTMTAFHAAAALTTMPLLVFAVAVATGSTFRAGLYAYFGEALLESGSRPLVIAAGVGLFTLALLPLAHPRVRRFLWGPVAPAPGGAD
jgi:uncharacterized membrane protein YdjX (TVP38/TMEM64 family)